MRHTGTLCKDTQYREIAWRQMLGQTAKQMAPAFGITPTAIRIILRSPHFMSMAETVRNEAFDNLKTRVQTEKENLFFDIVEAARPAFHELKRLMTNAANEQVRLKACTDILNRADVGVTSEQKKWNPDPIHTALLVETLQETA